MSDIKKIHNCNLWIGITFGMVFMILSYKLATSSLWFDETIEYWYSKCMFGEVPGGRNTTNMYERIISTYQPPLYNFLMFFWLKIHDSEWWFHFFGIPMGMIGVAGVYKIIEKEINFQAGCIAAFILSTTKQFVYYVQECSEYCILLAVLPWLFYFWLRLIEEYTNRNFLLFVVFAVLSIYSQYGAMFPTAVLSITAYILVLKTRNKKNIINSTIISSIAMIIAALPLWVFFLKKQIEHQQGNTQHKYVADSKFYLENIEALGTVFKFNFNLETKWIILILFISLIVILFTKKTKNRWIGLANILCWFIYYIAVKMKFYNYGQFGNRHSLFFLPIWLISIVLYVWEFEEIIFGFVKKFNHKKWFPSLFKTKMFVTGIFVSIAFCLVYNGWEALKPHWNREEIRYATKKWYEVGAYNIDTLVYYASDAGFFYYKKDYQLPVEPKITIMEWFQNKTLEEYEKYINELYNGNIPDELYLIGIAWDDLKTIVQSFVEQGYEATDVYYHEGGRLVYLKLTDTE